MRLSLVDDRTRVELAAPGDTGRSSVLTTSVMFPVACTHPLINIWKIDFALAHFLSHEKPDRAPKGLHVAKHFGPERPNAGHPITVQAPNQGMSNHNFHAM